MGIAAKQRAMSHAAAAASFRRMAELSGGEWQEDGGLLLYRTPVADPIVWNGAIITGEPHASQAQLLERADAFFAPHASSYGFWIVGSRDSALAQFLNARKVQLVDDSPHMVLDTAAVAHAAPTVDVELVDDESGRRGFVGVAAAAFQTIGAEPSTWPIVYPTLASVCADDVITVLATVDGKHVGGAIGYLHNGACEVIHVATLQTARRRGIGAAVTASVVTEARARGATLAVLQSTEHGEGVYRSLGFKEIDRYRLHLRTILPA